MSAESQGPPPRVVRVVAGNPTPEEVAVLVAVLAAAGEDDVAQSRGPAREWASPARAVRAPMRAGRGAWSHSAWPQ
ncbi:acyl-CoA carboxylase epsilon subunit [Nostocoides vanveenii]|uniref:Acyl-CoA carboxylase subunit epsilon n=1 Tax=Nostocoides vanveenii TaxID=330835 RepID=A0ABN2L4G3_9MICO